MTKQESGDENPRLDLPYYGPWLEFDGPEKPKPQGELIRSGYEKAAKNEMEEYEMYSDYQEYIDNDPSQ